MKQEIKVPAMGESISEASVGTIIKPSGSHVEMDDEILELETDKVNQVLYAPQAGIITLTVAPEETVKIGQIIGFVEAKEGTQAPAPKQEQQPVTPSPTVSMPKQEFPTLQAPPQERQPETSARFAKEDFVAELRTPAKETSTSAAPAPAPQPAAKPAQNGARETRKKLSKIRKVIAKRLVEVQQNIAMLTTFNEIDLSQIIGLRERYKDAFVKEHNIRLGFMSFFVKAVVAALKEYPEFNSYIDGDDLVHREYYDIGIAVSTDRGVIVPVVRDCDHMGFPQIEQKIEDYAKKAREGTISADDLQGAGFTITNGGVFGSLLSTPIVSPQQCGILGMHKISKRAVVVDDQVVIRPMMYLALSYDHRIVDGKEAVSFLVHVKNSLEDPARLLLDL